MCSRYMVQMIRYSLLASVSAHLLCTLTLASVALKWKQTVGTDLYVARVQDVTRDTISSTISCFAVSSVRGFWRHANLKVYATHELGKGPSG